MTTISCSNAMLVYMMMMMVVMVFKFNSDLKFNTSNWLYKPNHTKLLFSFGRKRFGFKIRRFSSGKAETPPTSEPDTAVTGERVTGTVATGNTPPTTNSEPQTASTEVSLSLSVFQW